MTQYGARNRRLTGCQFRDLGIVVGAVDAQIPTRGRDDAKLEFEALADGSADIGRELHRIGNPVGLHLDVAPVDIIGGEVGGYPAVQPACLGSDLVTLEIVRARARRNDDVARPARRHAGTAGGGIDDRRTEACREGGVSGDVLDRLESCLLYTSPSPRD